MPFPRGSWRELVADWAPIVTMALVAFIALMTIGGFVIAVVCARYGVPLMTNANELTLSARSSVARAEQMFYGEYTDAERNVMRRGPISPAHDARGLMRDIKDMTAGAKLMFDKGDYSFDKMELAFGILKRSAVSAAREIMLSFGDAANSMDDGVLVGGVKNAPGEPYPASGPGPDPDPVPVVPPPYTPRNMRK